MNRITQALYLNVESTSPLHIHTPAPARARAASDSGRFGPFPRPKPSGSPAGRSQFVCGQVRVTRRCCKSATATDPAPHGAADFSQRGPTRNNTGSHRTPMAGRRRHTAGCRDGGSLLGSKTLASNLCQICIYLLMNVFSDIVKLLILTKVNVRAGPGGAGRSGSRVAGRRARVDDPPRPCQPWQRASSRRATKGCC